MAFIRTDFSPVGAQGRAGVVPQVFAYTSPDSLATIKGAGYFPQNSTDPKLNMLGVFKSQDWIMVNHDTGGSPGFSIIFISNDGSDGNDITMQTLDINAT
ncbi:MAG: hypothetical protein KAV87_12995 [Desulfobacteraceae bacterium]|nr:hypothetical protein [Desulfobacteraceae bacterium]